jgi:hypothetical protein
MVPDKILFLFVAIRNPRWLPSQDKYNIGSYRTIIQNYSIFPKALILKLPCGGSLVSDWNSIEIFSP